MVGTMGAWLWRIGRLWLKMFSIKQHINFRVLVNEPIDRLVSLFLAQYNTMVTFVLDVQQFDL